MSALWEHYLFTQDKKYLKNTAYDILKGATIYCLEWLIEDKNGCLITSPSTSPENRYITPSGFCGSTVYGATADIAIIRELFDATLQAAKILNKDADLQARIIEAEKRLLPYKVGAKG